MELENINFQLHGFLKKRREQLKEMKKAAHTIIFLSEIISVLELKEWSK